MLSHTSPSTSEDASLRKMPADSKIQHKSTFSASLTRLFSSGRDAPAAPRAFQTQSDAVAHRPPAVERPLSTEVKALQVGVVYTIIPGRLQFTVHSSLDMTHAKIAQHRDRFYFSSDFQERYEAFCADFGPVNLGVVHKFCAFVREYWNHPYLQDRALIYYTDEDLSVRTNTAFLLAAYMVVELGYTPEAAWEPFTQFQHGSFALFRDATFCPQDYDLTAMACLQGLTKAMQCGFYDPATFDVTDYERLDRPSVADLHVVSSKFIAFKGPSAKREAVAPGIYTFTPEHYKEVLLHKGVSAVVRLNEPSTYDPKRFSALGIAHHDLYFDDCTTPGQATVQRFLDICESEPGMVAVHCRAGLGRTGTLIAIYLMKHFGFMASECIGWLRIVRPGSIIGAQQHYLHWAEQVYRRDPKASTASTGSDSDEPDTPPAPPLADFASAQPQTLAESEAMGRMVAEAQRARALRSIPEARRTAPHGRNPEAADKVVEAPERRQSAPAHESAAAPRRSPSNGALSPLGALSAGSRRSTVRRSSEPMRPEGARAEGPVEEEACVFPPIAPDGWRRASGASSSSGGSA